MEKKPVSQITISSGYLLLGLAFLLILGLTVSSCAAPSPPLAASPTPVPTLAPRGIAKLFKGDEFIKTILDNGELIVVPNGETRYLAVKHRDELPEPGNLHLLGGTQLRVLSVSDPIFRIELLPGSDLFVQTGPYADGAEIELAGSSVVTNVRGCMATYYADDNTLFADCFQGACALSTDFGSEFTEFSQGQQIRLDISEPRVTNQQTIPEDDKLKYWRLLSQTGAGREDIRRCNVPPPPTPTPTRTPTHTPAPPIPTSTSTLTPTSTPTFTPTTTPTPTASPIETLTPPPPNGTPSPSPNSIVKPF